MQISHLRAIAAVADTGSFTRAADVLAISQSGVSQAVSALEESLGAQLVVRGRHGVTVSAAGEAVVGRAREVLALLDTIHDEAAGAAYRGRLRIASVPSGIPSLLMPLVRRFRARYPGIDVVPIEGDDSEVQAWVAAGTVDMGLAAAPTAPDAVVLGADEWVAVLPRHHELARRVRLPLADLAATPFVLITFGCAYNGGAIIAEHGFDLVPRVETRNLESGLTMVREELGVTLVPRLCLAGVSLEGLVVRPLTPVHERRLGLSPGPGPRSRAADLLLGLARETVQH